jgi:hypothetical protein
LDQSAVERIARRELESLMEVLGIPHWRITVEYELPPDEGDGRHPRGWQTTAECGLNTPYNQATIRIAPGRIDDRDHLIKVLRHELFHVLLSPYRLYRHVQAATIREGSPADEQEDRLWDYCDEQAVINLERMYRGLTAGAPQAPPVARERRK